MDYHPRWYLQVLLAALLIDAINTSIDNKLLVHIRNLSIVGGIYIIILYPDE